MGAAGNTEQSRKFIGAFRIRYFLWILFKSLINLTIKQWIHWEISPPQKNVADLGGFVVCCIMFTVQIFWTCFLWRHIRTKVQSIHRNTSNLFRFLPYQWSDMLNEILKYFYQLFMRTMKFERGHDGCVDSWHCWFWKCWKSVVIYDFLRCASSELD